MTCAAHHLGDGTLRPLSAATAAAAGGAANSSKIGRNRPARSVATVSILCLLSFILPAPNGIIRFFASNARTLSRNVTEASLRDR